VLHYTTYIHSCQVKNPNRKVLKGFSKQQPTTVTLEESFDMLRLHIKYTVFDLEATRRENQYLKNFIKKDNDA